MKLQLSNINKPSHPKWAQIGNICLYAIPLYSGIIMTSPFNEITKNWLLFSLNTILATIKIISKFTLDPNYVEDITESDK